MNIRTYQATISLTAKILVGFVLRILAWAWVLVCGYGFPIRKLREENELPQERRISPLGLNPKMFLNKMLIVG